MSTTAAEAVHARLVALNDPDPAYDGHVPQHTQGQPLASRYVVLWADPGLRSDEDGVAATLRDVVCRFQVTSVGVSAPEARYLAQRSRDGLLTWSPDVDGMSFGRPEHESTARTRRDDDLPTPLFLAVDTYVVRGQYLP